MSVYIEALDEGLLIAGEWCTLRRIIGTTTPVPHDVTVRARVLSPSSEQLKGGYTQNDSFVIMSPTQINAAGWPDGLPAGVVHPEIPRGGGPAGDKIIVAGRTRNIESVNPIFVNDELVRIELKLLG